MTKQFKNGQILVDAHGRYHAFERYKNDAMARGIFYNLGDSHLVADMRPVNVTDPTQIAFLYGSKGMTFVTRSNHMKVGNDAMMCAALGCLMGLGVNTIVWQDFQINNPTDLKFRAQLIGANAELGLPLFTLTDTMPQLKGNRFQ